MLQLKDRQKSIPNGFKFYLPELKWNAPGNYPSFTRVCDALQAVINANQAMAQQKKWPTDRPGIEAWVDSYNASLCAAMGWNDYVASQGVPSVPKMSPSLQQETLQSLAAAAARAKQLVAGAKSLMEWDDSGDPPVERDLANTRALTCSACPNNEKGDWTKWFTVPAAELIKRRVQKAQMRNLSTLSDERIHFCSICNCPLKLKVHVPIHWIAKRLSSEIMQKLRAAPACWVPQEIPEP